MRCAAGRRLLFVGAIGLALLAAVMDACAIATNQAATPSASATPPALVTGAAPTASVRLPSPSGAATASGDLRVPFSGRPAIMATPTLVRGDASRPPPSLGPPPAVLAGPAPSPPPGQGAFATAYSSASAVRHQAWTFLAAMFEARPPAGLIAVHEELCQRYLGEVSLIKVPPGAQPALRTLQERAERDVASQRMARALLESYWLRQRSEDLLLARQAQEDAAAANQAALQVAQALGAELP